MKGYGRGEAAPETQNQFELKILENSSQIYRSQKKGGSIPKARKYT